MPHKYDNPKLNSIGFLFAIMHDATVALDIRMDAATELMKLGYGDLRGEREPATVYRFADYQEPEDDIAA